MENKNLKKQKLFFNLTNFQKTWEIMNKKKSGIFNFLNLYGVYWFKKEELFRESVSDENNKSEIFNFIDGFTISLCLSLKNLKRISRFSGPIFTRKFLINQSQIMKKSKILFVGPCSEKDVNFISEKFNLQIKNIFYYGKLPYIAPKTKYEKKDINQLLKHIKKIKPEFVFICVGNPRQEILAYSLYKSVKTKYVSIGAAWDFILERKKEAPKIIRKLGIEWLYRLLTDFKYSRIKVWRSFLGLKYLLTKKVKINVLG